MPETASREAKRNLKKDLVRKLGHKKAAEIVDLAYALLCKYHDAVGCRDVLDYVYAGREMYAKISGDSDNQKFAEWQMKKGEFAGCPVLGSPNDLWILSTAVYYVQMHRVELWTHDMDFTMFADEIYEAFGLRVVDTYRLGGRLS